MCRIQVQYETLNKMMSKGAAATALVVPCPPTTAKPKKNHSQTREDIERQ